MRPASYERWLGGTARALKRSRSSSRKRRPASRRITRGVPFAAPMSGRALASSRWAEARVFEAPTSEARSLAVIERVAALMPGKPIRYLVNSHHRDSAEEHRIPQPRRPQLPAANGVARHGQPLATHGSGRGPGPWPWRLDRVESLPVADARLPAADTRMWKSPRPCYTLSRFRSALRRMRHVGSRRDAAGAGAAFTT
jgi:hypothetical protein